MITSTAAPACVSLLARSAVLYAAMLPVIPRTIRLPSRTVIGVMLVTVLVHEVRNGDRRRLSTKHTPENNQAGNRYAESAKAKSDPVGDDPGYGVLAINQVICQCARHQKCYCQQDKGNRVWRGKGHFCQ